MKINIYYGGRGIIDDPTLFVISKITDVFDELNVKTQRYNLYEQKNSITALTNTLRDADGIILASTVEWYGVGGYIMQFLDACWLYGDKEKIKNIYMMPVVMSTTYGERDGLTSLSSAWEVLGGLPCDGICGYIADTTDLENNKDYITILEKKAENMYRYINQKIPCLPASNMAVKDTVYMTKNSELTPQESEQLSEYVSNDTFVKKQKQDIQELASLFRDKMVQTQQSVGADEYIDAFKRKFTAVAGVHARYKIMVVDWDSIKDIIIDVNNKDFKCYSANEDADVEISLNKDTLDHIIEGKMTFQRAFMAGEMKMKGDFKLLRNMDQLFDFMES
ncbi:MAG: SCP2 sterol-binding domain-containing protein [Butyrivibrio sp.]|nr:SCP2 sterol-binding domain-containing protein [Butyrivibrio sp.]